MYLNFLCYFLVYEKRRIGWLDVWIYGLARVSGGVKISDNIDIFDDRIIL